MPYYAWFYGKIIKNKRAFMADENIIKKTCREQGLTYKQLGELIGYSESAINNAARQDKISEPLRLFDNFIEKF